MTLRRLPPREQITVCFAHAAYRMQERFALRNTGIRSFEVRNLDELQARIAEANVLSVSGLWRNQLIASAPKLAFIQSISAGTDQYSRELLAQAGVRAASAQGVNSGRWPNTRLRSSSRLPASCPRPGTTRLRASGAA